jgi:hypothetical protein
MNSSEQEGSGEHDGPQLRPLPALAGSTFQAFHSATSAPIGNRIEASGAPR